MANNLKRKLLATVSEIKDVDSMTALQLIVECMLKAENNNEPDVQVEDDEVVVAPRNSKGKLRVAKDDDADADTDVDDDTDAKPAKTAKTAKTAKPTAKPTAKLKATENDYAEMSKAELKGVADNYGLTAKAIKGEDLAEMLEAIDTAAKRKPVDAWMKLARKADVEVTQPRGRSSDEKKSRVVIIHMINAGESPL